MCGVVDFGTLGPDGACRAGLLFVVKQVIEHVVKATGNYSSQRSSDFQDVFICSGSEWGMSATVLAVFRDLRAEN